MRGGKKKSRKIMTIAASATRRELLCSTGGIYAKVMRPKCNTEYRTPNDETSNKKARLRPAGK